MEILRDYGNYLLKCIEILLKREYSSWKSIENLGDHRNYLWKFMEILLNYELEQE